MVCSADGSKQVVRLTAVANNQVMALVRTSINQVANAASQQVYKANQDVTKNTATSPRWTAGHHPSVVHWMVVCSSTAKAQHRLSTSTAGQRLFRSLTTSGLGYLEPPKENGASRATRHGAKQSKLWEWLAKQPIKGRQSRCSETSNVVLTSTD